MKVSRVIMCIEDGTEPVGRILSTLLRGRTLLDLHALGISLFIFFMLQLQYRKSLGAIYASPSS